MNVDISIIRSSFWLVFVFVHTNMHRIYIIPIKIGLCFIFFVFNGIFQVAHSLPISSTYAYIHAHVPANIWYDERHSLKIIHHEILRNDDMQLNWVLQDQTWLRRINISHAMELKKKADRTRKESTTTSRFPSRHTFSTNNVSFFFSINVTANVEELSATN